MHKLLFVFSKANVEDILLKKKGKFSVSLNFLHSFANNITIPAVLHQVEDDLVQELLHQCSADPQVFQRLRRQVGQLGLPKAVVTQRGIVLLAEKRATQVTSERKANTAGAGVEDKIRIYSKQFTCFQ